MKHTFRIPLYWTFVNWLIVVAIGSLIAPWIGEWIDNPHRDSQSMRIDQLTISMFCAFFSAISSIPALVIMCVTHLLLNKGNVTKMKHRLIHNGVHLLLAVITFYVVYRLMGKGDEEFIWTIICSYVPLALIVWNLTYFWHAEGVTTDQQLLDENL